MVRLSASSEDEEDDLPALIPDFHDEEDTGQLICMPTNLQTTPQNLDKKLIPTSPKRLDLNFFWLSISCPSQIEIHSFPKW